MNTGWVSGTAAIVAESLAEMFRQHGVESVRDGDTLRFPAHPGLWAAGATYRGFPKVVQLDVRLGLPDGRTLVESNTGFGTEDEPATRDGLKAFARCTLPVLLAGFFGQPQHATRQRWAVGDRKRIAFVGEVTTRFGFPKDAAGQPTIGFFAHFKDRLCARPLPAGTHWVRVYQMRMDGKVMANEVLLDNAVWPEMQDAMAEFDWPPSDDKTYDVRAFLVMHDAP